MLSKKDQKKSNRRVEYRHRKAGEESIVLSLDRGKKGKRVRGWHREYLAFVAVRRG